MIRMKRFSSAYLGAMLAVAPLLTVPFAASASPDGVGSELEGNSAEAVRSDGSRAVIFFKPDHRVDFDAAMGDRPAHYHGKYSVGDGQLCFEIMGDRDCWRYSDALKLDHPVTLPMAGKGHMTAIYTLRPGTSAKMPPEAK